MLSWGGAHDESKKQQLILVQLHRATMDSQSYQLIYDIFHSHTCHFHYATVYLSAVMIIHQCPRSQFIVHHTCESVCGPASFTHPLTPTAMVQTASSPAPIHFSRETVWLNKQAPPLSPSLLRSLYVCVCLCCRSFTEISRMKTFVY